MIQRADAPVRAVITPVSPAVVADGRARKQTGAWTGLPPADDPELAEHALWSDVIAADLEDLPEPAMPARRRECACGLVVCFGNQGCPCGEMAAR